jgi:hypothetical protein
VSEAEIFKTVEHDANHGLALDGIDTSRLSPIHRMHRKLAHTFGRALALIVLAVGAVGLTYAPMFIASSQESVLTGPTGNVLKLPFLNDWSALFVFGVSLPMLVVLLVTDESVLNRSLIQVQLDGVVSIPTEDARLVRLHWQENFRCVNLRCQILGGITALLFALLTLMANSRPESGSWIAAGGRGVATTYFISLFFLYFIILFFVVRCIAMAVYLNAVVSRKSASISLQPFHPDHCGGLRPVGQLGLRNQYTVTILGLNIVVLAATVWEKLPHDFGHVAIIASATAAYLILGPIVFMGPLLPFHQCMDREKQRALAIVVERLRQEFNRISKQIPAGQFTAREALFVARLRKFGGTIEDLPVWPFDSRTLVRFASAYVIPIVAAVGEPIVSLLIGKVVGIK